MEQSLSQGQNSVVHPTAFPCSIKTYTQPALSHQARKEKGPGMGKKKGMLFHFLINLKFEVEANTTFCTIILNHKIFKAPKCLFRSSP